jgi:cell division protein FtsW (lipid II flippase)
MYLLINQRYRWLRGSMQVLTKCYRRARNSARPSPLRVWAWVLATYVPDLLFSPLLCVLALAGLFVATVRPRSLLPLAFMAAAIVMAQASAAAFFLAAHRDSLRLLYLVPLYGPHNGILLGAAWLIYVFDELRGTTMRW